MTVAEVMPEKKTIKDTLLETRDIINDRGWTKRVLVCDEGKVCLDGALAMALGWDTSGFTESNFDYLEGYNVLRADKSGVVEHLCKAIYPSEVAFDPIAAIFHYNDTHTEEEVRAKLDEAIERA